MNFYCQLEQTVVLRHSYELVLKLAQENLTCDAIPLRLDDWLYQMPWNSQVEFQGWPR